MKIEDIIKYTKEINVLYVEDDEIIREQTVEFLNKFFKTVEFAINGEEGAEKYNAEIHDLLITDINMPILNGIEMIKKIKEKNSEQIVIVTSAHNESDYLLPLINLGIDRFLLKPFDRKVFVSVLYRLSRSILFEKDREKIQSTAKELNMIMDVVDNGIFVVENGTLSNVNRHGLELFNQKDIFEAEKIFQNLGEYAIDTEGYIWAENIKDLIEKVKDVDDSYKIIIKTPLGNSVLLFTCHCIDEENNKYVLSFNDVTAIDNQTRYEQITKLPNRTYLSEKIDEFKDAEEGFVVFLITIKSYNSVVKWHGRDAGVAVEKKVSEILRDGLIGLNLKEEGFLGVYQQNIFMIIAKREHKKSIEEIVSRVSIETSIKEDSTSRNRKEIFLSPDFKVLEFKKSEDVNVILKDIANEVERFTL